MRQVRELAKRCEFSSAGTGIDDRFDARLAAAEIDRLYLRWGLQSVEGLTIDGQEANADLLIEKGPEDLCGEIVARIKLECGLSEEERKN